MPASQPASGRVEVVPPAMLPPVQGSRQSTAGIMKSVRVGPAGLPPPVPLSAQKPKQFEA